MHEKCNEKKKTPFRCMGRTLWGNTFYHGEIKDGGGVLLVLRLITFIFLVFAIN